MKRVIKMDSEKIYSRGRSFRLPTNLNTGSLSIFTTDCWSDFKMNTLFLCLSFPFLMTHHESGVDDSEVMDSTAPID